MSQAIFAKGSQLKVGNGATPTEVFTTIPEIRTISGPSMSAEQIDVTSHDTPGGFRDKIQGLKDWGVLTCEVLWVPNNVQHLQLFDDYVAGTVRHYKLTVPDANQTTLNFSAFIGNNPTSIPFDGALTKSVEFVIVGAPAPNYTGVATTRLAEARMIGALTTVPA
jgi:predicted secreted protein